MLTADRLKANQCTMDVGSIIKKNGKRKGIEGVIRIHACKNTKEVEKIMIAK